MKTAGLTTPLLVTALLFVTVWAVGLMTVRSSALATETSLEMLRLHVEVARLHDAMAGRSNTALRRDLEALDARLPGRIPGRTAPGWALEALRRSDAPSVDRISREGRTP